MMNAMVLVVLYGAIALSPILTVAALRMKGEMSLMHEMGTAVAFAAFGILALQPVLAARLRWVERPFGLDVVSRFHRYMGLFAVGLILAHPPLMAFGGGGMGLLTGFDHPWYIWVGRAVLGLLLVQGGVSIRYQRLGMTFEQWRSRHNVLAVVIISGAFVHSWWAGYDMQPIPMRVLWMVLFGLAAAAYLHHKVLKPRSLKASAHRVTAVEQETHNVWTIKLAPAEGRNVYAYHPGQFHFITLQRGQGLPQEEHHWTISSSPTQGDFLSSTIKESGDFTRTIGQTRPGDTALVEGPFGRFSYTLYPQDEAFVFIAGGIGITPLMSMLRHMRDTQSDSEVLLLYANRTESDIAFREELAEIEAAAKPRLKVVHIVSDPTPDWKGESGRLDHEKLTRLVGPVTERAFYICTPPPMTRNIVGALRSMGVPYGRMRTEEFSL